jgi:hypothetical protein
MATVGDLISRIQARVNREVTVERSTVAEFIEEAVEDFADTLFRWKEERAWITTHNGVDDYPSTLTYALEGGANPTITLGAWVENVSLLTTSVIPWEEIIAIRWMRHDGFVTVFDTDSDNLWEFTLDRNTTGYMLDDITDQEIDAIRSPVRNTGGAVYRFARANNSLRVWPIPNNSQLLEGRILRHTPFDASSALDSDENMWTDPRRGLHLIQNQSIGHLYKGWLRKEGLAQSFYQRAAEIQSRLETEYAMSQTGKLAPWPTRNAEWLP